MLIFGKYTEEEVNDLIDEWHEDVYTELELWEHLGVSRQEYAEFVSQGFRE